MTERHTPGPWLMEAGHSVICIHAGDANGGDPIANVGGMPAWKQYTPTDEANARLIAAAPDMLAALQAIASMSEEEIKARFGGHPSKSPEEIGRKTAIYHLLVLPGNIARAAIAKAEGKA